MRTGKNKPSLNDFLLEGVRPSERTDSKVVVDEGELLWSCIWSKKDTFSKIFRCILTNVKGLVLLLSFLMVTRLQRRTQLTMSGLARCLKLWRSLLKTPARLIAWNFWHSANKQRFVNELAETLELNRFETVLWPSDAGTSIVRTALETPSEQVTIFADDTDILCLLLHHIFFSNSEYT